MSRKNVVTPAGWKWPIEQFEQRNNFKNLSQVWGDQHVSYPVLNNLTFLKWQKKSMFIIKNRN